LILPSIRLTICAIRCMSATDRLCW
jgi:hypothetical protein